ncbi:MAG: DUF3489 domain-containing protein [Alphaproteobacteria bacterium]
MTKLTDTQLVVLNAAANREHGAILPLPAKIKGGAAAKVVDGLIRRGLAERIESGRPAVPNLVRVTRAGLEAIGVEPEHEEAAQPEPKPRAKRNGRHKRASTKRPQTERAMRDGTKQALLIDMLRRPEGATIDQIAEATGWQRPTVRGAIAGALKKKLGLNVGSEKIEGRARVYRIR